MRTKRVGRAGTTRRCCRLSSPFNSGSVAGLPQCSHDRCVAGDCDGIAELVARTGVGSFQVSLLTPSGSAGCKNIRRSGTSSAIVRLVTIYPGGIACLLIGSDHCGGTVERNRESETVPGVRIGSLKISLLAPGRTIAHENVGGAGQRGAVISSGYRSRRSRYLIHQRRRQ